MGRERGNPLPAARAHGTQWDENPPTAQPNREQPTDGGDNVAPWGATAIRNAEAKTGIEKRASSAGRPTAHPIRAATAAAVGDPFTAGPAPTEKEIKNGTGHPTGQTIGAALAAPEGGTVWAGLALSIGDAHSKEGGGRNPKESASGDGNG